MAKQRRQLHDLDASEVSLVKKGAVTRKFLITKSADDDEEEEIEKGGTKEEAPKTGHKSRELRETMPESSHRESTDFHRDEAKRHDDLASKANEAGDLKSQSFHESSSAYHSSMANAHMVASTAESYKEIASPRARFMAHVTDASKHLEAARSKIGKSMIDGSGNVEDVRKEFSDRVRGMISKVNPSVMQAVDGHLKNWDAAHGRAAQPAPTEKPLENSKEDLNAQHQAQGNLHDQPLTEEAMAALKAVVRILNGFKDQLNPTLLHEILEIAGFEVGASDSSEGEKLEGQIDGSSKPGEPTPGEPCATPPKEGATAADAQGAPGKPGPGEPEHGTDDGSTDGRDGDDGKGPPVDGDSDGNDGDGDGKGDSDVPKDHIVAAAKAGNAAYAAHMQKLGHKSFPEARMAMKASKAPAGKTPGKGSDDNRGDVAPQKQKGETVTKSAENTTVDLSQVDPKVRGQVEAIFKSNEELGKKVLDLETQAKARDERDRERELVAKAATWTHVAIPQSDLVAQLKDADKVGKDSFERICKSFDAINEQSKTAGIFGELGSGMGAPVAGSAEQMWDRIEKAAEQIVQKSAGSQSREQALEMYLRSPEGQRMYVEYKNAKGGV